jgi:hypothetical protein
MGAIDGEEEAEVAHLQPRLASSGGADEGVRRYRTPEEGETIDAEPTSAGFVLGKISGGF